MYSYPFTAPGSRYDVNGNLIITQIPDPVVIIQPEIEPVTLAEAKLQCEVDDDIATTYDSMLQGLITGARQWAEKETGLAFIDTTYELRMGSYSNPVRLRGPLIELAAFQYTDADGALQNVDADSYIVESSLRNVAPRIVPPQGVTWPATLSQSDSVRVRWRAGFVDRTGSPTEAVTLVPAALRNAILLHVQAHFDRDERQFKMLMDAATALCSPYRVSFGVA